MDIVGLSSTTVI